MIRNYGERVGSFRHYEDQLDMRHYKTADKCRARQLEPCKCILYMHISTANTAGEGSVRLYALCRHYVTVENIYVK